jgi:hypothetical protein
MCYVINRNGVGSLLQKPRTLLSPKLLLDMIYIIYVPYLLIRRMLAILSYMFCQILSQTVSVHYAEKAGRLDIS